MEKLTNDKKLELAYRQAILNVQTAKTGDCFVCIHHLDDLQIISPKTAWQKDGENDFTASAEFYFVSDVEGGLFSSSGNRINFHGKIQKDGNNFILLNTIIIDDSISTCNLKKCEL